MHDGTSYECDIFFDAWAAGSARSYVNREIPNTSPRPLRSLWHREFFRSELAVVSAGGFDQRVAHKILAVMMFPDLIWISKISSIVKEDLERRARFLSQRSYPISRELLLLKILVPPRSKGFRELFKSIPCVLVRFVVEEKTMFGRSNKKIACSAKSFLNKRRIDNLKRSLRQPLVLLWI